jgi:competence protein ComEC
LVPIGLASGLWHLIFGGESLPLAIPIQWLLETFQASLQLLSTLPGGEWHISAPSIPAMLVFYASLWLLCVRWGNVKVRVPAAIAAAVVLSWWIWSPRTMLDGDRFRVTFLDVGQGDSAVVELPDGQVLLIDGGATYERFDMGRGIVAPYLWNRGIRTLDHVIGTHPQLDHVGGLAWVIRHLTVKQYWGSGERREEAFAQRLNRALIQHGLTEKVVREGQEIYAGGGCRLLVLNPTDPVEREHSSHEARKSGSLLNNGSVVVRLHCGSHMILFTADVEREGLARMARVRPHDSVDVLKVPHHGALSSQNREWLESVDPTYAVISVGRHNPYGHPAPAVLESYAAEGVEIFRTDRDGAVWVTGRLSDQMLRMHRMRDVMLQPTQRALCLWSCEQANWRRLWQQWHDRL